MTVWNTARERLGGAGALGKRRGRVRLRFSVFVPWLAEVAGIGLLSFAAYQVDVALAALVWGVYLVLVANLGDA